MEHINWHNELQEATGSVQWTQTQLCGHLKHNKIEFLLTNKEKFKNINDFYNKQTQKDCIKVVEKYPKMIIFVKPENQTSKLIDKCILTKHFIFNFEHLLKYIIPEVKTQEFYNKLYKINYRCIENIPEEFITFDMCKDIYNIQCDTAYYKFIPNKFKNYDYYVKEILVLRLKYDEVPEHFLSKKFIKETIEQRYILMLNHVPNDINIDLTKIPLKFIDEDLCLFIIKKGLYFNIPNNLKTYDILLNACVNININILDIPEDTKNIELLYTIILSKASNENKDNIKHIPKKLLTNNLCMIAISKDISNLQYIPIEFQTKELCKFSLQVSVDAFKYIKNNLHELFDSYIEKEIDICPICVSNKEYFLIYICNHLICTDCVNKCINCYYRCDSKINLNECFKNLNYKIEL